jgi:hypothetical protein
MKWILLFSLISSVCLGQKVPTCIKHSSKAKFEIDLYPAFQRSDTYPLSMVAESLEYIPLELTENNLLGEYLKTIYITSDGIFVFDYAHGVYRFTREGKYLNKIGRVGRGPGECVKPIGMVLDSINKSVIFLDHDRLVKYDYEGNFLKNHKLNFNANEILITKDGDLLLNDMYYPSQKPDARFSLQFFSETSDKLVSKVSCEVKDQIPFGISNPSMYNYNGQTFIKDYWSDTIYQVIDPFNLKTYAIINTGRLKHRYSDDKSMIKGGKNLNDSWVIDITYISETDRFIFLTSNKGLFIYDKVSNDTFCCNYEKENNQYSLFRNDLTPGPNIKTFLYNYPISNNIQISYNTALSFFDKSSKKLLTGLDSSLRNLDPNNNQVLVIIKFKKE